MLTVYPANVLDTGSIFLLLEAFKDKWQNDFTPLDPHYLKTLIQEGAFYAVHDDSGYLIGAVWVTGGVPDLHASVYAFLRPRYWRQAFRERLPEKVLNLLFHDTGAGKLKSSAFFFNRQAIKLLHRYKFRQSGAFYNETLVNGKPTDVFTYELKRTYWDKHLQRTLFPSEPVCTQPQE